ncbi:class I SAM-dependent methyltransferase [Polynucleobacter sp. AP-Melu-500A-A1]|uniref:class I SAM-dependent methyltransferase n=1 Tax=Polynucleobacter sp. AP-Melu-500A-A1 TaxID=2576929 RepID=UPI002104ABC5|nr:class I SAM-dependent methyltransferase [Polynucleobacter sp. AP-Melu-500A-A1]MBU3629554.1 methyltransferase domain-containing protein [Polynucleobacter sp. AP-Melu-500A-A1]
MTQSIKWLQDEIAERMLQKLDIVKLEVKDVLLIPEFPGRYFSAFKKRFPGARIYGVYEGDLTGLDVLSFEALQVWRRLFQGSHSSPLSAYLKSGKLDLPDNSVDLIFCNLLLQDLADPAHFLQECWRTLKEGGLLTFSYLGPDTGKELRSLDASVLKLKNLLSPWDMHDMGDALVGKRFSDPVMDMEFLHLNYVSDVLLLADAQALKLLQTAPTKMPEKGLLPQKMTLEVVYGHAWAIGKHLAKAQDNVAYIDINQIGHKTR